MGTFIFFTAWTVVMLYVTLGNYLYFTKVLPALSRDGLDGSLKFTPSKQLGQVEVFLSRFPLTAPRPWFYGVLLHIRAITAAVLLVELVGMVALILSI
jgi:hypothetical protein